MKKFPSIIVLLFIFAATLQISAIFTFLVAIPLAFLYYKYVQNKERIKLDLLRSDLEIRKRQLWEDMNKDKNEETNRDHELADYLGMSVSDFKSCMALHAQQTSSLYEESTRAELALNRKLQKLNISYSAFKTVANGYK